MNQAGPRITFRGIQLIILWLHCLQRRPEIHLFAARFKEEHGDIEGARFEYEFLNSSLAPGLLESIVKAANFEHRQVCLIPLTCFLGALYVRLLNISFIVLREIQREHAQCLPLLLNMRSLKKNPDHFHIYLFTMPAFLIRYYRKSMFELFECFPGMLCQRSHFVRNLLCVFLLERCVSLDRKSLCTFKQKIWTV